MSAWHERAACETSTLLHTMLLHTMLLIYVIQCVGMSVWLRGDNNTSACVGSSQPEALCILNTDVGVAVSVSHCSFHAGRCHGDPLFFISEGVCDPTQSAQLEWVKFRAQMSSKSSVRETCGLDTCYQWETCSGEEAGFLRSSTSLFMAV